MDSLFAKIKERLEEKMNHSFNQRYKAFAESIEIVNQVAEEYKHGHFGCNSNGQHERCVDCGLRGECSHYNTEWFGSNSEIPNMSENITSSDGWIPCSERLPEVYGDTKSSDVVLVCGYDEESDYNWQAMGFYVKTEAIKRWFFAECKDTDKPIDWIDIVAWQPLPAPYKPKGEK